jgi:predicted lipase
MDITHKVALDLLRITILIYSYGDSIKTTDDTIENFVSKITDASQLKISDMEKQLLFDVAKNIPSGKVCNFINDAKTDLQAGITINEIDKRICVVFRGSQSSKDWFYDLSVVKHNLKDDIWVHGGFYKQLYDTNVYESILQEVKLQLEKHPDFTIYITGHSLGAALATLFGYLLAHEIENQVSVVSFASPRIGDAKWQKSFESKDNLHHYRVTNCRDIITAFPVYNYKHVGTNIRLFQDTYSIHADYKDDSWYDYTIARCWSVADHGCDLYYKHLIKHIW